MLDQPDKRLILVDFAPFDSIEHDCDHSISLPQRP
jgi:hypothetical protein